MCIGYNFVINSNVKMVCAEQRGFDFSGQASELGIILDTKDLIQYFLMWRNQMTECEGLEKKG